MKDVSNYKIVTPHAAAIIWNYTDRIGPNGAKNIDSVEKKIISTLSLISIKTSKSKSTPSGNFELVLAPTKNWVSFLTEGSWMCIMMSQDPLTEDDFKKADPNKVKFFGRIESVRVEVRVEQESGARKTFYTVSGSDWAQVFNSILYVDPVARETPIPGTRATSEIGNANRMLYNKYVDELNKKMGLPTSTSNLKSVINFWGTTNSWTKEGREITNNANVLVKPDVAFQIPLDVFNYFNFKTPVKNSRKIADMLNYKTGILSAYDTYKDVSESVGVIKPDSLLGAHTVWQVINDNCNNALNEVITDIRWDNGVPALTLYKRIRPFCIRPTSEITVDGNGIKAASFVKGLISRYENVRRVNIPIENVISFNAGTNWRDKYNYCEIQIDNQLQEDVRSAAVKVNSAIFSEKVFSREGFRPMIVPVKYLTPTGSFGYDVFSTVQWKYLLKEWYFDTHNTLNGTIAFVGINDYIQVGDNILMDASLMGKTNNTNVDNFNNPDGSYILGHVESISHSFNVDPESGARSYFTTVQFVRGIITDANGRQFNDGRIEINTGNLNKSTRANSDNVFATSSNLDPDTEKVDGK